MARTQRNDPPAAARRAGPYETRYDVLRGYDVPPPAPRNAARTTPGMVAARGEDRDDRGPYG